MSLGTVFQKFIPSYTPYEPFRDFTYLLTFNYLLSIAGHDGNRLIT